jgi:membrane associated rhomboid family serine protease
LPPARRPILTYLYLIALAGLCLALASESSLSADVLAGYGIEIDPGRIWGGNYLALLAMAFLHLDPLHLLFDVIWIFVLGRRIEQTLGDKMLLGLILAGSVLPNAISLGVGSWPVLGSTGVVYTLLGFVLAASRRRPARMAPLPPRLLRALLVFLPLCCLMGSKTIWNTLLGGPLWSCGAVAPPLGLLTGWCAGLAGLGQMRQRLAGYAALGALAGCASIGVLKPSFNPDWQFWQATRLAARGETAAARRTLAKLTITQDPMRLNQLAWAMATAPEAGVRNGMLARELAERGIERVLKLYELPAMTDDTLTASLKKGDVVTIPALVRTLNDPALRALGRRVVLAQDMRLPAMLDTLAAAHAEAGDWERAEGVQRLALLCLENSAWADPITKSDLSMNMERIRRRVPIRDYELFGHDAPTSPTQSVEPELHPQRPVTPPAEQAPARLGDFLNTGLARPRDYAVLPARVTPEIDDGGNNF